MHNATTIAVADLLSGLANWRLWSTLGWHDIRRRYRRSVIGPFWLTLSMAILVTALGVLYSTLFRMDISEYMPFVTAGFLVWGFITTVVNESCVVFVEAESVIKQVRMPLSVFVYRLIWRNMLVFLHHVPVLLIILMVFRIKPTWSIFLAVPGFVLLCINAGWVGVLLGVLGTRFRDVPPIVASVVQVFFFITPVFWSPDLLQGRAFLVDANLFYHFIEIVRGPLLGYVPSLLTYLLVLATTLFGWIFASLMFHRFRNRIAYWL